MFGFGCRWSYQHNIILLKVTGWYYRIISQLFLHHSEVEQNVTPTQPVSMWDPGIWICSMWRQRWPAEIKHVQSKQLAHNQKLHQLNPDALRYYIKGMANTWHDQSHLSNMHSSPGISKWRGATWNQSDCILPCFGLSHRYIYVYVYVCVFACVTVTAGEECCNPAAPQRADRQGFLQRSGSYCPHTHLT